MLIVLFGIPGVGKSFIGRLLAQQYGYYFYEADQDLTPAMIQAIQSQTIFTEKMRDEFFEIVINKLKHLACEHKKIVVAQALAKEKNREQIRQYFPDANFILIEASDEVIAQRLQSRSDWITVEYAKKIKKIFEKPQLKHSLLDNNTDIQHVKKQLEANTNLIK